MKQELDKLSIVLWNTQLSPPVNGLWNQATDEKKEAVAQVIQLFINAEYDFICLSEVSPNDMDFLNKKLDMISNGYSLMVKEEPTESLYFDTGIFFKNDYSCLECRWKIDGEKKHRLKAYQYYYFINKNFGDNLIFYFAHLPSRLGDKVEERRNITSYIRSNLSDLKDQKPHLKFVVLGDFNAEPHDSELVHGLRSSRHQQVVKNNNHLLYNPFWKFLPATNDQPVGTFFFANGQYNQWSVFDQILFSGSFFKQGWKIKDENICILNITDLIDPSLGITMDNPSDHLPVHAILEK